MDQMTSAAGLLLKLYELRTEPTLRQARAWFAFEFHPQSTREVLHTWLGPGYASAPYRMVTTYWDMAASLVIQGAIPAAMFNAANTEHFGLYAKLRAFLPEIRATTKYSEYLVNVEQVAMIGDDAESRIATFAKYMDRQRALALEGKQRVTYEAPLG